MTTGQKPNTARIALMYGLGITILLIAYFMTAIWMGFVHNYFFRVLNAFFMMLGIVASIKHYKKYYLEYFSFWKGFMLGLLTSFIAVGFFSIYMFVYTEFIDPDFLQTVVESETFGRYLYPAFMIIAIFAEGLGSGLVITLGTMLYLKDSRGQEERRRENT